MPNNINSKQGKTNMTEKLGYDAAKTDEIMARYEKRNAAPKEPKVSAEERADQQAEIEARDNERGHYIDILKGASFSDLEKLGFSNFAEVEALNGVEAYNKLGEYRKLEQTDKASEKGPEYTKQEINELALELSAVAEKALDENRARTTWRQQVLQQLDEAGVSGIKHGKDGKLYAFEDAEHFSGAVSNEKLQQTLDFIMQGLAVEQAEDDRSRQEIEEALDITNTKGGEDFERSRADNLRVIEGGGGLFERARNILDSKIGRGAVKIAATLMLITGVGGVSRNVKPQVAAATPITRVASGDSFAGKQQLGAETTTQAEQEQSAEKWVEGGYSKEKDPFYSANKEQKVDYGPSVLKKLGITPEQLKTDRNAQEKWFQEALKQLGLSPKQALANAHDMGNPSLANLDGAKQFNKLGNDLEKGDAAAYDKDVNDILKWIDGKVDGFRVREITSVYGSYYMNEQDGHTSLAYDPEVHHGGIAVDLLDSAGNVLATWRDDCGLQSIKMENGNSTKVIKNLPQTPRRDRTPTPTPNPEPTPEPTPTPTPEPEPTPPPETEKKDESKSANNQGPGKDTGGGHKTSETPIEGVTGDNGKNTGEADTSKNTTETGNEFQAERPF